MSPRKHSRGIRDWISNKHFSRDKSSRDSSRKEHLMGSRSEKVKVTEENQAEVLSLKSVKEYANEVVKRADVSAGIRTGEMPPVC